MTTDESNLWTAGNFRMRNRYSITSAGAGPGLRGCTQDLRAGSCPKPSSRTRSESRVGLCTRVSVLPRAVRAAAPLRSMALCRHSSGTAARPAGGRARTGATENLGSRRRLGGGTSVSEGSDAVGSVKGVHARGGNHSGDLFGAVLASVAPVRTIIPTPAVLATSSICPGRFRVDGSTFKVLCRVVLSGGSWCLNTI